MEVLLSLFYTLVFIYIIHKASFFETDGLSRNNITALFLLKIVFGLAIWLVYTHYYTDRKSNDVFRFYDDGGIMFSAIYHNPIHYLQMVLGINSDADYLVPYYKQMANWYKPWAAATYHNNRIIIRFNALVYLFSWGYYNVHTVFMCFTSLTGLMGIYKTVVPFLMDKKKELAVAVFLIPSVLFWGSGVLKEGIIICTIGMVLYFFTQLLYEKFTWVKMCFLLFFGLILAFTKIYVFAALIPSLLAMFWIKKTDNRFMLLKFISVHLVVFLLVVNANRIKPEWDILKSLEHKQWSFLVAATREKAGSLIYVNLLEPSISGVIKNTPDAIVNTLFRPYPHESKSLFMLLSSLENIVMLFLIVFSFLFFKKPEKSFLPLWYTSLFFVLTLALLIGLVNPVLGSIVRFRAPLLPFFAILFIALLDKPKLLEKFPDLKPWL